MSEVENYRKLSSGLLTVYGNSVLIKEFYFPITDKQRKRLAHDEFTIKREYMSEKFDEAFEEHVMKYGEDFEDHEFWRFKKIQKPPKRKKGDIKGFSKSSRYRLLKKLNQLNPDLKRHFFHVTLTYPKRYPEEGEQHKADLDAFIKRIKRKFGDDIMYLWKLEFQKRGAPHYHMIIYLPRTTNVHYLRRWFGYNWFQVVQRYWEFKDKLHMKAGVGVDRIESLQQAGSYLSKYIAKDEDWEAPEYQGRYWGCSRNWGDVILEEVHLTGNQLIWFRRLTKRYLKGQDRMQKLVTQPINLTVFGYWGFFTKAIEWVKKVH